MLLSSKKNKDKDISSSSVDTARRIQNQNSSCAEKYGEWDSLIDIYTYIYGETKLKRGSGSLWKTHDDERERERERGEQWTNGQGHVHT